MANLDTVQSITKNLETVIKQSGLDTSLQTTDIDQPASDLRICEIHYDGENFFEDFRQKPRWNEMRFRLRIIIKDTSPSVRVRSMQESIHFIRDNVTVNALNIGDLVSSKLVSLVTSSEPDTTESIDDLGIVEYNFLIRYREL